MNSKFLKVLARRLFWMLFFLVPFLQVHAQGWSPLPQNRTLLYSYPAYGYENYIGLQATSVTVEGADTAYYLYRIDRPMVTLDPELTCFNSAASLFGYAILVNRDHYLGKKMLKNPNGDCLFVGTAGDSLLLKTQANLGDTWNWSAGITATVSAIQLGTVLGATDSLKTIDLSNGKQIVLSKTLGMVHCFNFLPYGGMIDFDFELWGIPDLTLGDHLPTRDEVAQLDPQDRFGVHATASYMVTVNTWYNTVIQQLTASYTFATLQDRLVVTPQQGGPTDSTYYPPTAATMYVYPSSPLFNQLPLQTNPSINPFGNNDFYSSARRFGSYPSRVEITIGSVYEFDTCAWAIIPYQHYSYYGYTRGLGLTNSTSYSGSHYNSQSMYCYQKGSESWGTCLDLGTLLAVDPGKEAAFSVSPNPAQDHIRLHCDLPITGGAQAVSLVSMDGRVAQQVTMPAGASELDMDVRALPAGVYLLRLQGQGIVTQHQRIVVVH